MTAIVQNLIVQQFGGSLNAYCASSAFRLLGPPGPERDLISVPTRNTRDFTDYELGGAKVIGYLGEYRHAHFWRATCECGALVVSTSRDLARDIAPVCEACMDALSEGDEIFTGRYRAGDLAWFLDRLDVRDRRAMSIRVARLRSGMEGVRRRALAKGEEWRDQCGPYSYNKHISELHRAAPDCQWCLIEIADSVWRDTYRPDWRIEATLSRHESACNCSAHSERRYASMEIFAPFTIEAAQAVSV
jgi:hypothetical protein